jgi:archaellum component FlaC
MNDANFEILKIKIDLNKFIEEIKYKHIQNNGTFKIPEKSAEVLELMKRTIELINHLYDFCCKQNTDLSNEKLQNLKNFKVIAELKNDINKLKKLSKF